MWIGAERADGPHMDGSEAELDSQRRALFSAAREFLLLVSPRGEMITATDYETLGYDPNEVSGSHIAERIHPDDLLSVFGIIERARETAGFTETIRARAAHKDGSWHIFDATVMDAALVDPSLLGAIIRVRDITEELDGEIATNHDGTAKVVAGDDRFVSLAEALPLGILSADARGFVVYANDAAQQVFGLDGPELLGRGYQAAVADEDRDDVVRAATQVIATGTEQEVTARIVTGAYHRWAHTKFVPLGPSSRPTGWLATVEDVTDRRAAESRLAHLATHDALTGLPNRLLLEDRLEQACSRLQRARGSVSLFFIDLDRFKDVNDHHGHTVGDSVLAETARRLQQAMRDVDTLARLGGDEFVVLCESLDGDETASVARRIAEAIEQPMEIGGIGFAIGASVGIARSEDRSVSAEMLLGYADQDMYRVKRERSG